MRTHTGRSTLPHAQEKDGDHCDDGYRSDLHDVIDGSGEDGNEEGVVLTLMTALAAVMVTKILTVLLMMLVPIMTML